MMKQIQLLQKVSLLTMAFVLLIVSSSNALKEKTHERLNRYVASNELNGFNLDSYLRDVLLFERGISDELIHDNKVR